MKRKFLSLAIAALAAFGFMATAQDRQIGVVDMDANSNNKMYTPQTFTDYAFEGILLDIPQQQRIDSLHSAMRTPCLKKVNAITMAPDSAKGKPVRHGGKKPERINGGAMGVMPGVEYVAKVNEILTPDQFDIFMSNIQAMPDNVVNNLLPTPQGRQHAAMGGKPCQNGDKQCGQSGKCDKQGAKECDKACDKKCMNSSDKCGKSDCKAAQAQKDKKGTNATKDKKDKKDKKDTKDKKSKK